MASSLNPLRMSINALPSGEELASAALGGLSLDPNQPMAILTAPSVSLPSTAFNSAQSTPMRGGSYAGVVDGFQAKPGETDAQFASRLTEAVGVAALADSLGGSMDHHRPVVSQSYKAASLPATPLRGSLAGATPVVNSISSGGTVAVAVAVSSGAGCSSNQSSSGGGSSSKDMGRSSSSGMGLGGGMVSSRPPKPPPKLPSFATSQSASKQRSSQLGLPGLLGHVDEAPSAPPLEDLLAHDPLGNDREAKGGHQDMCIICLSSPSQAGFLHGSDVHRCVCSSCSRMEQWVGMPCPVCRAKIEKVLGVF